VSDIDEQDEILDEFLTESREVLAEGESNLVEIERERMRSGRLDLERINRVFRAFHSVKGTAGFLALHNVVRVTHQAESLLDLARSSRIELQAEHVTALCEALDFVAGSFDIIERERSDQSLDGRARQLASSLSELVTAATGAPAPVRSGLTILTPPAATKSTSASPVEGVAAKSESTKAPAEEPAEPLDFFKKRPEEAPAHSPEPKASGRSAGENDDDEGGDDAGEQRRASSSSTEEKKRHIRVDVEKLDALMTLVGELILAENMVTQNDELRGLELENFTKAALHLNRITRSLQDIAMSVRMVPIRQTFRKMLRLVRDLSQRQGKHVDLTLLGEDTEVDKNLIEAIADPLVHIIRNGIDHGIQTPAEREAAGKPPNGTLCLEAKHQGGEVWIVITDDGRGLNRDRILAKAIERGLVAGDGAGMADSDVYSLIFEPGFSTADAVTDVSGRGVGMDVVKRNIEALGGRVDLASQFGRGTQITLRIPLTLAIIDGMLVRVGASYFTLPLLSIVESLPIPPSNIVRVPGSGDLVNLREGVLPLYRLEALYNVAADEDTGGSRIGVVIEHTAGRFCLLIDELVGQRQTVIKALPTYLGSLRGISGCSILSNGEISLILDLNAISSARLAA
jgi:two-component system chemotaxis sensor kinase CheA